MMGKNKGYLYLLPALALVFAGTISCGSVPDTAVGDPVRSEAGAGDGGGNDVGKEPDWVIKYPVDPEYFIGVGSSNTGDRGEDMDKARLDALAALSSSIVTNIEAEIVVESTDDTEGNSYERVSRRIEENVEQSLRGVEPVDSYYSKEDGYWFYFRYPKTKLREMKEDLTRRVLEMLGPGMENGFASVSEGLALLWDGYSLVFDSPFVGTIEAEIGDYSGALIDILQKEISRLSASLTLTADPDEIRIEQGQNPTVTLSLENEIGIPTGQFHAKLTTGDGKVTEVVTDKSGRYSGKLELTGIGTGRTQGSWKADFGFLGIDTGVVRLFVPETPVFIEVEKKSVGLKVETGDGVPFQGLGQSVSSLFSDNIPFEIVDEYRPDKTNIVFTLHFRDLPENDFGLYFTFARAVISVEQGGKRLYSFESEEYKEGGITVEQARERAKADLFEALAADRTLYREIETAATSK